MFIMSKDYTLQEIVFKTFLKNPKFGPSEMSKLLNAKYNSIKAIYAKLCDEGLLIRESRGVYAPNYSEIILHLMDRVEHLERVSK